MTPLVAPPASAAANGTPLPELDPALIPNLDDIVTEDGKPVDSIYAEKQMRLWTEPLYSSWSGPGDDRPFLALANVGFFHTVGQPPLVPDAMLSLDVVRSGVPYAKEGRSYFMWILGKPPDAVLEHVSDRRGGEDSTKMREYARHGVLFYIIYDPGEFLDGGILRAFVLERRRYQPIDPKWLAEIGLGLTIWEGTYEDYTASWLRWCDAAGRVIPTGAERAWEQTRRADEAEARVRHLEEQLRGFGAKPKA